MKIPRTWTPRPYQLDLWRYLQGGGLRADVAAHRRWGKDEVALHWTASRMVTRPGVYWHMLPEAAHARKAIWEAVNPHTGRRRIDEAFPKALRASTRGGDMRIELKNGAVWQVAGSDNYDRLVGASPLGVVFSEWALAKQEAWTYLRPILAENGGWALFLWTPRGRNHAVRAFESRSRDPDWFTLKSPATHTDVFTAEQLAKEEADLVAETGSAEEGRARFATEYLVAFDAPAPGAYYGAALAQAETDGRITAAPHDPSLKVDTAWDLGIDDATAIWFLQEAGREVRVIDYFEASGEGLQAIVRQALADRPFVYGRHYLPHDVKVRELGANGRSRLETLAGLGVSPVEICPAASPEDRIHALRQMIPMAVFDGARCAAGLDRLRAYRKRWSPALHAWSGPLHDGASHAADALGLYALNRRGGRAVKPPARRREHQLDWMA